MVERLLYQLEGPEFINCRSKGYGTIDSVTVVPPTYKARLFTYNYKSRKKMASTGGHESQLICKTSKVCP